MGGEEIISLSRASYLHTPARFSGCRWLVLEGEMYPCQVNLTLRCTPAQHPEIILWDEIWGVASLSSSSERVICTWHEGFVDSSP